MTVKFFGTYMTKPLYFFGKLGLFSLLLSFLSFAVAVTQKYGLLGQPQGLNLNRNLFVALAALLIFFTVQCVMFGVLSELLVRIYHDSGKRPTYHIRRIYRHDPRENL